MSTLQDEVLAIEKAIVKAQLVGDFDYFEQILADDFQFITPQGKIVTKKEDIAQYKSGDLKMNVVDVSDQTIRCYGSTAISRFKVKFEGRSGKYDFSANYLFTRVYVKQKNKWQMIAGHSTELKC